MGQRQAARFELGPRTREGSLVEAELAVAHMLEPVCNARRAEEPVGLRLYASRR